jgi:hypothetical protein
MALVERLKPNRKRQDTTMERRFLERGDNMASQLNSQHSSPAKPQGSPYCADPNCESCKELRETQERIRSENFVPRVNPQGIPYHRGN